MSSFSVLKKMSADPIFRARPNLNLSRLRPTAITIQAPDAFATCCANIPMGPELPISSLRRSENWMRDTNLKKSQRRHKGNESQGLSLHHWLITMFSTVDQQMLDDAKQVVEEATKQTIFLRLS
jgi:hypothetical protein